MRGGWSTPRLGSFIPGKDTVSIVQEAGVGHRAGLKDAENLAPTRIRYEDRPARSEWLYRLHCPGPQSASVAWVNVTRNNAKRK